MEMSHEAAVQEYLSLIPSHVHPEFLASTPLLDLLHTKGVRVFVPQNWRGIKAPPIELQWKEGMPTSLKPRARSINPKIFESAKVEFNRLRQYFYAPLPLVLSLHQRPPRLLFGSAVTMSRLTSMLLFLKSPYPMCSKNWRRC